MRYEICVKQVPEIAGSAGNRMVMNAYDASALEAALQLCEAEGGEVHVVTVGPSSADAILSRALAMGAATATRLLCDQADRLDSFAVASILGNYFQLREYDFIFCGKQSQDNDSGLVGGMLAELLGMTYVSNAVEITAAGDRLTVVRQGDEGQEIFELSPRGLVTCSNDMNDPRLPSLRATMAARSKPIGMVNIEQIPENQTIVDHLDVTPSRPRGEIIGGESVTEAVHTLFQRLNLSQLGLND